MPELTVEQAFQIALEWHQAGRLGDAEQVYEQILNALPNHADAMQLLGMVYFQTGRLDRARAFVERAIRLSPEAAIYHNNYGQVLEKLGETEPAAAAYRTALKLDPNYPEPYNNLGNILDRAGQIEEAIEHYRTAVRLNPNYAEALTNLGNIHKDQGDLDAAISCYRRATELRPDLSVLHSNLLLALHYHPNSTSASLAEEHVLWRKRHADPLRREVRHANTRDPDRGLRIGYVSPDFREHPVARFLLPLLGNHDPEKITVFGYADVARPDRVTSQIRSHLTEWRDITHRNHTEVAELIREDKIDILIDLVAHSSNSRLLVFARRPAPVQVTYLAYPGTTGLTAIDYRLSDPYLDPVGTDLSCYAEKTVRLPETYWCYSAPSEAPLVNAAPSTTVGSITFGCLNNFCKVTEPTLQAWGRILQSLPTARLLLYARDGGHRQRVYRFLGEHQISPDRIEFVGKQNLAGYFGTYHRIDIGLDPFPYTGGTTTCDALWMGVPVLTWAGATAVARSGSSILSNLGLGDFVTRSSESYVNAAINLGRQPTRIAELRATLRARMLASPLMAAARFTRNFELALHGMWREWCQSCGHDH